MRLPHPFLSFCILVLLSFSPAHAQSTPGFFDRGWDLETDASALRFQSIKKGSVIESSSFATITGGIDEGGMAQIKVLLDSVDTKVDLRNVRMRFLFFETFNFPEALVTMKLDPAVLADLPDLRRKVVRMPYALDLHGVTQELEADLAITLISDDLVAVSTNEPITLGVADFNLMDGLEKLQDAASVTIVPSTTITFDFIFKRRSGAAQPVTTAAATSTRTALEAEGDFSREACIGRFEILSRSGNIYFAPGSARLTADSTPILNTVLDIVSRCPGLVVQVAGHTDSIGPDDANQGLSERRAASVAGFLTDKGIAPGRVVPVGFGETRPVAPNDTKKGRGQNRRIEFSVNGG